MASAVIVGWGTFRGKSERYAKAIAASIGITARALNQIEPSSLEGASIFVACLSTCGNGAYTQDAGQFISGLAAGQLDLSKLKVAILGLGSSHYPKFCKAGDDLYGALTRLGATPLIPYARSDLKTPDLGIGAITDFQLKLRWAFTKAGLRPRVPIELTVGGVDEKFLSNPPRGYAWVPLVGDKEVLSRADYIPRLWRFRLQTDKFKGGDHALVLVRNDAGLVLQILAKYGIDPRAKVTVKDDACTTLLSGDVTAFDLFSLFFDLSAAVPESLKQFGDMSTVGALLTSVSVPLTSILPDIPQMQPRTYSISSARQELALIIGEVLDAHGVRRPSSGYWAELSSGVVALKVIPGSFGFQADKDLIMVALGSGIAAIMSILWEWVAAGCSTRAVLFYGARYAASAEQLVAELSDKAGPFAKLELFVAISREGPKEHTGDVLLREKDRISELWTPSSVFYYCGSPAGYEDTKKTLVGILGDAAKFEEVKAFVEAY